MSALTGKTVWEAGWDPADPKAGELTRFLRTEEDGQGVETPDRSMAGGTAPTRASQAGQDELGAGRRRDGRGTRRAGAR